MRGLYERGFSAKDVRELFRVIDWLMELPPPIERQFWRDLDNIQKEKQMPYVPSIVRIERADGRHRGIEFALKMRFGQDGLRLVPEVKEIYDEAKLEAIFNSLETAATPDDVRRVWATEHA